MPGVSYTTVPVPFRRWEGELSKGLAPWLVSMDYDGDVLLTDLGSMTWPKNWMLRDDGVSFQVFAASETQAIEIAKKRLPDAREAFERGERGS